MAVFSYKATDSSGKIVNGSLALDSEQAVVAHLQAKGLIPIRIQAAGKERQQFEFNPARLFSLFRRVSNKDVMLFTQDLGALLAAGVPVDRALDILSNVTGKTHFKEVLQEVLKLIQSGSYLSDALAKFPHVFSEFYVNMIRAGEAGGVIEAVLERLGEFLESSQDLKDFIKSALVYPIFLVSVGGVSIIILMTYVIPKFAHIFADMKQAIPLSTKILLWLSDAFRNYWWAMMVLVVVVWLALWRYKQTDTGRLKLDQLKMRLPALGDLVKKIEVARFTRTLGTLIRSGVPILQALELVKDTIGNRVVAQSMVIVRDRVKEGERLSRPLNDTGHFPHLAVQMITVGEETGRLEEMLLRIADNYDKIVRNITKRFISLLEPAMILAMGLIVGFIVISMLVAIFSMNEMPF